MKSLNMKNRFLATALFMLIATGASAQNSQVLYFMNLPQNHLLNPALRPTNSVYIGLPVLTGINFNIKNNFFNFSDVLSEGMKIDESNIPFLNPDFDRDKFLGRLKELNYLEPTASVQLFGLGFSAGRSRDLYFFLDVNEHVGANIVFPRDLLRLAFIGNEEFAGQTFDLSALKADLIYYREIGIGASKNITPKLRLGAKGKLLFGIAGGSFRNSAFDLTVNNDYSNTLNANLALNISGPVEFYINSENHIDSAAFDSERFDTSDGILRFLTNTGNTGFGLDLGAQYSLTDKIILSAAVTDIGFIKWKTDISNLNAHGNIELRGLDFADIYNKTATIDELAKNMLDSLVNAMYVAENNKPFTTKLPVGLAIGGKYNLNDKFSFGLLSYSRLAGEQIKEALTISANMNIGNSLSTSLTYTACNNNYSNLGFGLAFRALCSQIYFLVDRIPMSWKEAGTRNNSVRLPANWNTLHASFGMNLVFGNKMKKTGQQE
jgi:Family of unknown function (DUF5723)